MSSVEIRKVTDKRSLRAFIDFHYELYQGSPYDAPTLYSDELHTFSKDKNAAFEFCEAEYFLAYKDGKLVGRVAGIINHRANEKWNRESVRFGWIDFVDDIEVSKALLDAVADWGRQKGMKEIVGPLGFTDMDPEGMLIFGFDQLGTMSTIYNYSYYPQHMEQMGGWEKDNDYVEFKLKVPKGGVPEKYKRVAELTMQRYNLHIPHLKRSQVFGPEQYGQKVLDVVNKTFADLYGFLSRALQKCRKGRLFPFGWWHILRALKFHKTDTVDLLLVGILPEYRAKGANALLFNRLIPVYQKYGFKWGETNVEMETNEKVQGQWAYLENELHKRRRCFKKSL